MNISGPPLRDSYHFGQTIYNDFGRPYDQGGNFVTGATASAVAGRFFFYVQGEYEDAPGRAANTPVVQNLIFALDSNTLVPPAPVAETNPFYPLDIFSDFQLGAYPPTFSHTNISLR